MKKSTLAIAALLTTLSTAVIMPAYADDMDSSTSTSSPAPTTDATPSTDDAQPAPDAQAAPDAQPAADDDAGS